MFLLLLMGLGAASVSAQVRIGGDAVPNPAVVLDLNKTDTANYGTKTLALPRVNLTSTTDKLGNSALLAGMLVYNTNTTLGAGIYFWDGSKWIPVPDSTPNGGVAGTLTGAKGTYKTWCFPASTGLGCWMTDNSKEGTPDATAYPGQAAGLRGYYYLWENTRTITSPMLFPVCPAGSRLPTMDDVIKLQSYFINCPSCDGTKAFLNDQAGAGYTLDGTNWSGWDTVTHLIFTGLRYGTFAISPLSLSNTTQIWWGDGLEKSTVRCLTNTR